MLAAAPVLMLAPMVMLPVYLLVFVGPEIVAAVYPEPFLEALVVLIVVLLALAAVTRRWARRASAGQRVMVVAQGLRAPLMMSTLAVVVGSQIAGIGQEITSLLAVIPLYAAFLVLMVPLGITVARGTGMDQGSTTEVVFSGATRNSLVVLPLALALPELLALVGLVVVTQTLVGLIGMVLYVKLIPPIIGPRARTRR